MIIEILVLYWFMGFWGVGVLVVEIWFFIMVLIGIFFWVLMIRFWLLNIGLVFLIILIIRVVVFVLGVG